MTQVQYSRHACYLQYGLHRK